MVKPVKLLHDGIGMVLGAFCIPFVIMLSLCIFPGYNGKKE